MDAAAPEAPGGRGTVRASCPACSRRASAPFHRERGWRYVRCRACRTVYLDPRPAPAQVLSHYDEYLPADPARIRAWARSQAPLVRGAVRALSRALPPGSRVLDVGCGYGQLAAALAAAGFRAEGVEISPVGARHARSLGVAVHEGTLESAAFPAGAFDGLAAYYVVEHLDDPGAFLAEAARVLRPGGALLLRWPQSAPLVRWCRLMGIRIDLFDAPSHLTDFTPESLRALLEARGFEGVRTRPGGSSAPAAWVPWLAGRLGGLAGDALHVLSGGRFVAPGASKTTIARRGAR
ncbi:MAG: class I SAM-dependent methyltransferase [Planctomycetes bacterium]|jgi:SAM-dependent methyltransferase|nr:class I SAM-dependent methyltransferase [Planctomycetota bacterium]